MPDNEAALVAANKRMSDVIDSINSWVNKVEATATDSYEKGLAAIVAGNVRELLGPFADPTFQEPSWS